MKIGILTRAGQAKKITDESQIKEEIQLAWNGVQVDGITKGWDNITKAEALNTELLKEDLNASASWNDTNNVIDVRYKGYTTTITPNTGAITEIAKSDETPVPTPSVQSGKRANITPAPTGTTYTEGQEVTFENEKFFVISDDGTTVKLLAKYCLNQQGTIQINESYDTYGRIFSKTNYWSSLITSDSFDLQSNSMIIAATIDGDAATGIPNAVLAAQTYGISKEVKGRLMTYYEANTIKTNGTDLMKNILYGKWSGENSTKDGYLFFWLGTANNYGIQFVDGSTDWIDHSGPQSTVIGVRPVLEIQ